MRIVTRGDFDGLISSVLISEAEEIDDVLFVHPKKMQDGEVEITGQDIIVNLPFHPSCGKWFDHHISEAAHGDEPESFEGKYGLAPSAARLVYEYYNLPHWDKYKTLLADTDKIDSAQLSLTDILRPTGWVKLSNTVDPRTGFERSKDYFLMLIERIKNVQIEDILELREVRDKLRVFFEYRKDYEDALKKHTKQNGQVVITDFRLLEKAPIGSRFLVYALFPSANVSVRLFYLEADHREVRIAVGKSILNRTCEVDVGTLLAEYGGGGHVGAGSCRVHAGEADDVVAQLMRRLNG